MAGSMMSAAASALLVAGLATTAGAAPAVARPSSPGEAFTVRGLAAKPSARCHAPGRTFGPLNTRGVPAPVAKKARVLYRAAWNCDRATLVRVLDADGTYLGKYASNAATEFRLPARVYRKYGTRYDGILAALSTRAGMSKAENEAYTTMKPQYEWPRVVGTGFRKSPQAWREAARARLLDDTPAKSQAFGSYLGWAVHIMPNGTVWSLGFVGYTH